MGGTTAIAAVGVSESRRVQPAMYAPWRDDGRRIRLEPEDVGWARIFYGLDPDGYEVMFERFLG